MRLSPRLRVTPTAKGAPMNAEYPQLLADLADRLSTALANEGLAPTRAREIGFKAAEAVRAHWGGQLVYIPVGTGYEISERDREIWDKFNGDNHEALAREYQVTVVHVYRIVKRMHAAARARNQKSLFDAEPVVSSAPSADRRA